MSEDRYQKSKFRVQRVGFKFYLLLSTFYLLLLVNYAFSLGLSVQPGIGFLKDVPIGRSYRLDTPLSIHNKSDFTNVYTLSTFRLSEIGKEVLGYLDIPDPSWLYFERNKVEIKPHEVKEIWLYLNIPKSNMYYNQHWVVGIEIKSESKEKRAISLALYPYFIIETQSKTSVKESYGEIGIFPHKVIKEDVPLGIKDSIGGFKIYNNTHFVCSYTITSCVGEIHLSPSYSWIPNPGWILPSKQKVMVAPGESEVISLEIDIPKEKGYFGRHFEGVLWIKPSYGKSRFVRVQIITEKEKEFENL